MNKLTNPEYGTNDIVIGIDPGVNGAVAVLNISGKPYKVFDIPIEKNGKRNQVSPNLLAANFEKLVREKNVILCVIEDVSSSPQQGVCSAFSFGMSFGTIKGIIAAHKIRVLYVRPSQWKKQFTLIGKEKDQSRTTALNRWPILSESLSRKKDVDRAEAFLIAEYGRNTL